MLSYSPGIQMLQDKGLNLTTERIMMHKKNKSMLGTECLIHCVVSSVYK